MRSASNWFVLGIDLSVIVVSFVLAYIIRFNMSVSFEVSKLELQLPVIALIALMAFLVTGSYKGVLRPVFKQDVTNIFNATFLICALTIPLLLINRNWEISDDFNIPLSIILIYGILAFLMLTGTHYVYRVVYNYRK